MPTLVHGVDISTLEGWMIKFNHNPSMFGKSHSRRWFRVSFVPAGNDQKLIISYSTNKTSKEPRGWLYIEDVSGVYCRRDMIEVVSTARTLQFKGETSVEHRLWSDSLHKLCNPPKPVVEEEKRLVAESTALHERQRDRQRIADPKKTREFVDSSRESCEAKTTARKSVPDGASSRDHPPPRRRESAPEQSDPRRHDRRNNSSDEGSEGASASEEEEEERTPPRRRPSVESPRESRPVTKSDDSQCDRVPSDRRPDATQRNPGEDEGENKEDEEGTGRRRRHESDDDDDSDAEEEEELRRRRASQATSLERLPSLLVASIKSLSPVVSTPAQPKPVPTTKPSESKASPQVQTREVSAPKREVKDTSDSEEEEDEHPQDESPRVDDAQVSAEASQLVVSKAKPKSHDYFDEDEHEEEEDENTNNKRRPSIPTVQPIDVPKAAPASEIRPDNNFADDDWDAEEPTPTPSTKHREATRASPEKRASAGFGGVAADANFATEDWD